MLPAKILTRRSSRSFIGSVAIQVRKSVALGVISSKESIESFISLYDSLKRKVNHEIQTFFFSRDAFYPETVKVWID
jgi:hypothetical protein